MPAATYFYPVNTNESVKHYGKPPLMLVSQDTHSLIVGYLLWLIGFSGAHRFYYGKPITGLLWLFTFGLLGIGWLVDFFLVPSMDREANFRFAPGQIDYNLVWILFLFLGWLGVHRFVQNKWITGVLYFFTFGLFGFGLVYDLLTLNSQVDSAHRNWLCA
ncbi:MAG TPA: NINE protein [Pirellulaceae bacterium]|nr:NINE protein [Pirellulaceae bacterium]HMO93412.1 NINE protein [Pirellulaceae bacterium]HMP70464.1 NINE protein [Pirellulaceae bacterium]